MAGMYHEECGSACQQGLSSGHLLAASELSELNATNILRRTLFCEIVLWRSMPPTVPQWHIVDMCHPKLLKRPLSH